MSKYEVYCRTNCVFSQGSIFLFNILSWEGSGLLACEWPDPYSSSKAIISGISSVSDVKSMAVKSNTCKRKILDIKTNNNKVSCQFRWAHGNINYCMWVNLTLSIVVVFDKVLTILFPKFTHIVKALTELLFTRKLTNGGLIKRKLL